MLEMKSRSALIALIAGTTLTVMACGDDDGGGGNPDPTTTVAPVSPTVTPNPVSPTTTNVSPTVNPTSVNPVSPTTTNVAPVTPPTGTGEPMCDAPPATPATVEIVANYGFSDGTTTYEVTQPTPGTLCLSGTTGSSATDDNDYANWGAGLGLQVGMDDDTGYDAAALGIAGVQFELSSVTAKRVRVQMTLANIPEITDPALNFAQNAYGWGSTPKNITADGPVVVPFSALKLPSWTTIPDEHQADLDATRLNALQVQIANEPTDTEAEYNFCVTKLEWINACGDVVAVSVLPAPGDATPMPGGDGGVDTTDPVGEGDGGVDTTAPATDDAGGDTTDPMPTGEDDAGVDPVGEEFDFAADIHPILTEKCGQCHGASAPQGRPQFAVDDAAAAETVAVTNAANIATRIQAEGQQHMPPMNATEGDLSTEQEATLIEWAGSL